MAPGRRSPAPSRSARSARSARSTRAARTRGAAALTGAVALVVAGLSGVPALATTPGAQPRPAVFRTAAVLDTGGMFPGGTAVADVTGDGTRDVVIASASTIPAPAIAVAVGDGKGGFAKRITTDLPGGVDACDVAAGDLNGDGLADIAVSTCDSSGTPVFVMTNDGDGTFTRTQQIDQGRSLNHPAIADLNADGKADLVVTRESGGTSVYLGKGDGTVGAAIDYPAMSSDTIRVLDVTGDGLVDLSFTGPTTMVNKGGGVFGPPVGADFFDVASAVADLDGDGIPDGVGVDASGRHVLVAHGLGDGRYHLVTTIDVPNVTQLISVAAGDFNGDGHGDAIVNGDGEVAYLLTGNGDLTLDKPVGLSTGPEHLRAEDLDGAGAIDLLSLGGDPGRVYGVLGGRKHLGAAMLYDSGVPGEVAVGDVDGDGRNDIVTAGGTLPKSGGIWSTVGVKLNKGKEKFGKTISRKLRQETGGAGVTAVTLADLNADGKLDVIGGFENIGFSPSNIFVALGRGDGHFKKPQLLSSGDADTRELDVTVGDVTGDGVPDIVGNTKSQISVLPGKGNGTFQAPILSGSAGLQQWETLLGDVTGDGLTDVVAVLLTGGPDFSSGAIILEAGDGHGHFVEAQRLVTDTNFRAAIIADLNGDGRLDVAADGHGGTNGGRSGLHVAINNGSGQFKAPVYYASGDNWLVAGDFNRDGSIDLATDGPGEGTAIDLNKGNGTFTTDDWIVTLTSPAYAADVTGDDAPELFSFPTAFHAAVSFAVNITPSS